MAIAHKNMLPGLTNKQVEFFQEDVNEVSAFHDRKTWKFEEMPAYVHDFVRAKMGNPVASIAEVKAYVMENHGGLDRDPDIDENGNVSGPEYVEGRDIVPLENGGSITPSELRVLKLATLPDKIIADQLFLAKSTVDSHWQHMRNKTGLSGKGEFILFASHKGVI